MNRATRRLLEKANGDVVMAIQLSRHAKHSSRLAALGQMNDLKAMIDDSTDYELEQMWEPTAREIERSRR